MNITNTIISHPRKFSLILSLLIAVLFLTTTPKVNVGYGDSDEFLSVGHTWGLAHPPGYSLYVTVLNFASHLPIPSTTEAQRMHAVSGVAAAIAIYFVCLLLFEIDTISVMNNRKYNKSVKVTAITITVLTLATAKLFWLYAQIAEKYIFSTPFIALLLLLGHRLLHNRSSGLKTLIGFGLTYGLLISHHQSMIFLLPFVIYVVWASLQSSRIARIGLLLASAAIGIIFSLSLVVIQQSRQVQPSWYINQGFTGLVDFVTRKDFVGTLYKTNTPTSGYLPKQITLSQITNGTTNYFRIFFESTAWWTIGPLLIGALILFKRKNRSYLFLALPPLLIGIGLAIFLNWPPDLGSQATTSRFYIPSFLTWAPLLFLGLYEITYRLHRFVYVLGVSKSTTNIFTTSLILIPLITAYSSYPQVSLKNFDLVSRLYNQVLTDVKPNSLITCYSDSSCFALLYEQTVNRLRPDVDVVPLAFPLVKSTIDTKKLARFTYADNPYLMMDIVTWNIGSRPVYAVDISQYYDNFFGFNKAILTYIPAGYAAEISRVMPDTFVKSTYDLSKEYVHRDIPSFDTMRRFLVQSLSQIHFSNSYAWLRIGDRPQAQSELSLAVNLAYQLTDSEKFNAQAWRNQIERTLASPAHAPGAKSVTSTELISYLPELFRRNFNSQAFNVARAAIMADPRDVPARIELAKIYEKMGDMFFTKREYLHVLMLDPQNQEAIQALEALK